MDAAAGVCAERKPRGDDEIDTDLLIMRRCEAHDRIDALDEQVRIHTAARCSLAHGCFQRATVLVVGSRFCCLTRFCPIATSI